MTLETVSFNKWCELLIEANSNPSYIYERQDNKNLITCNKNTDSTTNLKKISLNIILGKCDVFQEAKNVFPNEAIKSINDIKIRFKKKYCTNFNTATTLCSFILLINQIAAFAKTSFDRIANWTSNKKFVTHVDRIESFILRNRKIDLNLHVKVLKNEPYENITQHNRNKIGRGMSGNVYHHKADKNVVVKESANINRMKKEFELGFIIESPYIAKSKAMYILKKKNKNLAQILMEKITGTTVKDIVKNKTKIEIQKTVILLENAKKCSLDLFHQKIVWADLNGGNIFITENGLKLCDLEHWETREEEKVRGRLLLIGALQLTQMIVENTEGINGVIMENSIQYPKSFFGKEWDHYIWCHMEMGHALENSYIPNDMDEVINKKLCQAPNVEEVITNYFDAVISSLTPTQI